MDVCDGAVELYIVSSTYAVDPIRHDAVDARDWGDESGYLCDGGAGAERSGGTGLTLRGGEAFPDPEGRAQGNILDLLIGWGIWRHYANLAV